MMSAENVPKLGHAHNTLSFDVLPVKHLQENDFENCARQCQGANFEVVRIIFVCVHNYYLHACIPHSPILSYQLARRR